MLIYFLWIVISVLVIAIVAGQGFFNGLVLVFISIYYEKLNKIRLNEMK